MDKLILFIGNSNPYSTAQHRCEALKRLGYNLKIYDPYLHLKNRFLSKVHNFIDYRTGFILVQKNIFQWVKEIVAFHKNERLQFIWVDQGELFGLSCINELKKYNRIIILYNNDDPTGTRDGNRFYQVKNTASLYDLIVTVREKTKEEFKLIGAKNILRVTMSYDEIVHQPFEKKTSIKDEFRSDVAFIGTWMRHEKRDEFLLKLIHSGLNIAIWGDRWHKSSVWNRISPFVRGGAIGGHNYVTAIQGAKICLGLLSKGNRDLHTQRSLEIPYAGGLLCAERTSEHLAMYKEGEEAVFWSNVDECVDICKILLADDELRERIRLNGMKRVRLNKVGNEDICREILEEVEKIRENK